MGLPGSLILNLSVQVLTWLAVLLQEVDRLGEASVVLGAILLVVALGWDFLTSGERITNPDPARFPRQARVFAYCGYLILVGTYVLVASGLGSGHQESFLKRGTEAFVVVGLLYLGIPSVLAASLLRLRNARIRSGYSASSADTALSIAPVADAAAKCEAR